MKTLSLVFAFGGLGCVLRYLISFKLNPIFKIPLGTLLCNAAGSIILCVLAFLGVKFFNLQESSLKTGLMVGLMGGLTTYSTYNLEVYNFIQKGQVSQAIGYFFVTASISLIGALIVYRVSL